MYADPEPPMEKGTLTRVPPSGMANTLPPWCLSHPATIRPACAAGGGRGSFGGAGWQRGPRVIKRLASDTCACHATPGGSLLCLSHQPLLISAETRA